MAFQPSLKRKIVPANEDLDITPIMNLVVVLIPLLLATAQFIQLGLLETRLPPSSSGAAAGLPQEPDAPMEKLSLVVSVDSLGVGISIFGATSSSENADENYTYLPRLANGNLDFAGVGNRLHEIRQEVVIPSITGEVQNMDARGKPAFNPDGTPQMVDEYRFEDAESVMISAPNDLSFQTLVSLLDATRSWKNPETGKREMLFPSPLMGKIQ